jgi:hypothetical protein
MGVLPLEFGVTRGWSEDIVKAVLKAHPAAATALDPIRKKKKFDPKEWSPQSPKGCRFMRKIALDHATATNTPANPEVLRLLPRPNKSAPLAWTDGKKVQEEEEAKALAKAEKEAKKKARAAKVAAAKAAKAEKLRLKQEAKAAKEAEAEAAGRARKSNLSQRMAHVPNSETDEGGSSPRSPDYRTGAGELREGAGGIEADQVDKTGSREGEQPSTPGEGRRDSQEPTSAGKEENAVREEAKRNWPVGEESALSGGKASWSTPRPALVSPR